MAKKSFSITGSVLNTASIKEAVNDFKIVYLDIDDIKTNDFNFYSVDDVETLKESIEQFGLQQPLVVTENEHILISGHRRFKAICKIKKENADAFSKIPCYEKPYFSDDAKSRLALITANSTVRELTDFEKMEQVRLTKDLLKQLKKEGFKLTGRQRELICSELQMSATQVQRLDFINKNLIDEYKEEFKNENILISIADEIAHLSDQQQKELFIEVGSDISLEQVKTVRKEKNISDSDTTNKTVVKKSEIDLHKKIIKLFNSLYKSLDNLKKLDLFDDIDRDDLDQIADTIKDLQTKYNI